MSSKTLLGQLRVAGEHPSGYTRDRFPMCVAADHDGCDTRREVLLTEAVTRPTAGASCVPTSPKATC